MHQGRRGVDSEALFLRQIRARIGRVEGTTVLVELRRDPSTTGRAVRRL